jgi:hypothetical protein
MAWISYSNHFLVATLRHHSSLESRTVTRVTSPLLRVKTSRRRMVWLPQWTVGTLCSLSCCCRTCAQTRSSNAPRQAAALRSGMALHLKSMFAGMPSLVAACPVTASICVLTGCCGPGAGVRDVRMAMSTTHPALVPSCTSDRIALAQIPMLVATCPTAWCAPSRSCACTGMTLSICALPHGSPLPTGARSTSLGTHR